MTGPAIRETRASGRRRPRATTCAVLVSALAIMLVATVTSQAPSTSAATLSTVWVDPVRGSDANSGTSRARALRTLAQAWNRIPQGTPLTRGVRIAILPGRLTVSMVPNYLESRYGTKSAPIVIEAVRGPGTVTMASLNVYDTRYLTLRGVRIQASGGDGFHCELCDHVSIVGSVIRGASPDQGSVGDLVKINQSQHITITGSDISGAADNAVDFVAVQYGAITGNRIHDAGDWCAYVKGGSAYIDVIGNEIYDCGTGGFTAGQGTGFQFMVAPWLHYEAYGINVVNNVIHDTQGAGLGVNGGYNILMAHNTLMRVGARSHVAEFVAGGRSCDGSPGDEGRERCSAYLGRGGWGTTAVDSDDSWIRIPNRHVAFVNNLIVNPPGQGSQWQHFTIAGPYASAAQAAGNAPNPALFDDDLVIAGNVISNGPADHPLGLGDDSGCQSVNVTCNAEQMLRENRINRLSPGVQASGRPTAATVALIRGISVAIPRWQWADVPGGAPAGPSISDTVLTDRAGAPRTANPIPGAYQD